MPECKKSSPVNARLISTIARGLLAVSIMYCVPATAANPENTEDSRKLYSSSAPSWLRAVGKLLVPGSVYRDGRRSHLYEDCSATLVTDGAGPEADTIITAWHCLANYNDLSKPITFALVSGHSNVLQREAYRLADGGGMHADWAILRLRVPVAASNVTALLINPGRADPQVAINMAGYSRDRVLGDHGNALTFDPDCHIIVAKPGISDSNCLAYKGASGGAVVQLSVAGTPLFSGIISEGDSAGVSTFVPVGVFRSALKQHLQ